jgi:hypothetical protein
MTTLFFQERANGPFATCETVDGEHGRIETRRYFTTDEIGWLPEKKDWPLSDDSALGQQVFN